MFELYLKPGCPYCNESKKLIVNNVKDTKKYKFYEIDDPYKREQLKVQHKMDTFPQIFFKINNKKIKIGGNDDLKKSLPYWNNIASSILNETILYDLEIVNTLFSNTKIQDFVKNTNTMQLKCPKNIRKNTSKKPKKKPKKKSKRNQLKK